MDTGADWRRQQRPCTQECGPRSTEQFLGSPSEHRGLLAQQLLPGEGV